MENCETDMKLYNVSKMSQLPLFACHTRRKYLMELFGIDKNKCAPEINDQDINFNPRHVKAEYKNKTNHKNKTQKDTSTTMDTPF